MGSFGRWAHPPGQGAGFRSLGARDGLPRGAHRVLARGSTGRPCFGVGTDDKGLFRGIAWGLPAMCRTSPPQRRHRSCSPPSAEDRDGGLEIAALPGTGSPGSRTAEVRTGTARTRGVPLPRWSSPSPRTTREGSGSAPRARASAAWRAAAFKVYKTEQGLGRNTVFCIPARPGPRSAGSGTPGGLTRYKNGKVHEHRPRPASLLTIASSRSSRTATGHFWMSCNRGIFRVSREDLNDVADGARRDRGLGRLRNERRDAGRKSANGPAAARGLERAQGRDAVVLDPPRRRAGGSQAHPCATSSAPGGHRGGHASTRGPTARGRQTLVAPPGDGEIEIHYTGLSFLEPEKVRFKYRLVGFDRDWVDAGTRRVGLLHEHPARPLPLRGDRGEQRRDLERDGGGARLRAASSLLPDALVSPVPSLPGLAPLVQPDTGGACAGW